MADQIINIGAAPNDGTGDPLRTAFSKTNNNFSELYTATGANSNSISVPVSAQVGGPTVLLGSVNVGTATPVDLVNINGNPSSTITGPTVRFTTNTDAYPLSQLFNYTHDNLAINFDSYNSSGSWYSGFTGSVYQIAKVSGLFSINYAANTTQGSAVTWNSGLVLSSYGVTLGNSAGSLLSFGGNTSSFPAIKRDNTGLAARLADDSGNAPLSAGVFSVVTDVSKITLGQNAVIPAYVAGSITTSNSYYVDSLATQGLPGVDRPSHASYYYTSNGIQATSGLSATYYFMLIGTTTLSANAPTTLANAIGFYATAPTAGTNVTITTPTYAIFSNGSTGVAGLVVPNVDNNSGRTLGSSTLRWYEAHLSSNLKLWNGASTTSGLFMQSTGDGIAQMTNVAGTGFSRLQFGGTTSSYPAIKRDGVGLQVRLADDTNTAPLSSGIFSVITNSTKTTLGQDAINFPYTSVNNVTTNNAFFIDSQSSQTLPGVNTSSHYSYLFTSNGLPASPGLSATYAYMRIAPGALSAAAPTTIANTYGLVVVAPTAGTNVTITNPIYAIISSGSLNVAGATVPNIDNNSGRTLGSSTLRWYEAHLSSNLKLWNGASTTTGLFMQSNGDGIAQMTNVAGTDFSQLQFGGTTSSYPSLKRDNTGLAVRLADDSGNASLSAGILTGLTSNGRFILGQDSVVCPFISVANTTMNNAFITNWSTLPGTNQPIHSNYYFTSNTPTMAVVPNLSTTYTFMQIVPPTLSAASATNITNAYGLYVGAPSPGTNMALNNNYSIWCASRIAGTTMVPDLDNNSSRNLGFAATRWYDLFLSHSLKLTNSTSNTTSNVFLTNGDGILSISNNAGTGFGRLQLGGTTSSYPAIKRDGAGIQIRLADDTGFAGLSAADIMVNSVSLGSGGVSDTYLYRFAAGIIAQRNGTNAQGHRIYNTYNGTNDEFLTIDFTTFANTALIGPQKTGTGTQRRLIFDGADYQWLIAGANTQGVQLGAANFFPLVDIGVNLGTTSNRWNNLCAKTILATGSVDAITVKNNSTSGWSDIIFADNSGNNKGGIGYGNSTASVFASLMFLQAVNVDLVICGGASGTTETFRFNAGGGVTLPKTITAAGTTGAQTINKPAGAVNFAAAATSLVVTNSLVTVNSVVNCQLATNDTTAVLGAVVKAAGSFTIFMKTAPTAETRVDFVVATV